MKALITAFALLSFVAASTVPFVAAQAQTQTTQQAPKKSAHKKVAHKKSAHKKVAHKKSAHKKVAHKKTTTKTAKKPA